MSKLGRLALVAAALSGAAACAPAIRRGGDPLSPVISREQIAALHATDALEVVKRLRGQRLHVRGATSLIDPGTALATVYVDRMPIGPVTALRDIAASDLWEIRFLSAWDATTKYGGRHRGGVIEVTTWH